MKIYTTASAFRRALEDRLIAASKAEQVDLQRVRRQVAFDRLLVRLFAEGNPPWQLKGGYALELKLTVARATRDLDLGLSGIAIQVDDLLGALQDAASGDAGDFFIYQIGQPVMDLDGAPYGGSRYPVVANLDGRLFARFHVDIGLGDLQRDPCEWIEPRDWLGFAGIPTGNFPTISREEHFAQKIHAYTIPRGERTNTRVKDLIDLVLFVESAKLDISRLRRDIKSTFARRNTHGLPEVLTAPPEFWKPVFEKLANECGIDRDMWTQFEKVNRYFSQLL